MSVEPQRDGTAPSLLPRGGLLALCAVALLVFAALFPLAYRRVKEALLEAPSALSLTYLRLAVAEQPRDPSLKLRLAESALALGRLAEARDTLAPVRGLADGSGHKARLISMRIERAAWMAVPETHAAERAAALAAYRAAIAAVDPGTLSDRELTELADVAGEAGEMAMRARLLASAVRGKDAPSPELVGAAERAFLESGQPLEAARIAASSALRSGHADDALRALTYARAAALPSESWAMFERLLKRFGRRTALLDAGVSAAIDRGDHASALALAEELLEREPERAERHAAVLQLATWSGKSELALVEQLWLLEHGAGPEVVQGALANARALSDLRTLAALYEREGRTEQLPRPELLQLVAVYEALGRPEKARELLMRALLGRYRDDYELWNLRLLLERARGRYDQALETLRAIDARFPPDLELRELRADLLLGQGRAEEALEAIADVTPRDDYVRLTRLARVAEAAVEVGIARRAYRDASRLEQASEADFARLYRIDMLEGDVEAALATARRGLVRFPGPVMLELTIDAALKAEQRELLDVLFASSEQEGHPFRVDPRYVALRVSHRQARAADALGEDALDHAERLLAQASADLARGLPYAEGSERDRLLELLNVQRTQALALALARDDVPALRALYPQLAATLSPRERVHLLHRMDRDDEAVTTALSALESDSVDPAQREGLLKDAKALTARRPRQVGAAVELLDMGALTLIQGRVQATWAETRREWSGGLRYIELADHDPGLFTLKDTHELIPWVGLRRRWRDHEAAVQLGVDLRNGKRPRPFVALSSTLQLGGPRLIFAAQIDEPADDTAALRALGVRDQLSAGVEVPIAARWFATTIASGSLYSSRDRELLGGGATVEAALGMRLFPVTHALHGNVRLAARAAPRWAVSRLPSTIRSPRETPSGWLVPDSSSWVGVGASIGHGQLSIAPVFGRELCFIADAAAGWLFPQQSVGFFARGGLGASLFGRDLLTVSSRAGNVVGTTPASTIWSVQLDYSMSLWR